MLALIFYALLYHPKELRRHSSLFTDVEKGSRSHDSLPYPCLSHLAVLMPTETLSQRSSALKLWTPPSNILFLLLVNGRNKDSLEARGCDWEEPEKTFQGFWSPLSLERRVCIV